uniref:Uncharacterized protein n=1 Tax=Arundo donax TaxID=35708 RepID=A0A0A9DDU7_ARUDO
MILRKYDAMCVIRMVIYVVPTSLIIVLKKLPVTIVPNLIILAWEVSMFFNYYFHCFHLLLALAGD